MQDGRKLGYGPMHGIPMVATSPVRHDSPVGPGMIGSSDIQSYEPPWKALSDFALHTDLDRLNPNAPHFQHLVNQVRVIGWYLKIEQCISNDRLHLGYRLSRF